MAVRRAADERPYKDGHSPDATHALAKEGWTPSWKMAEASWRERVTALNRSGYARYDESTSRMLGGSCDLLNERYGGDLRKLREAADDDPRKMRRLLREFKGMDNVGVDIFFREVQELWTELYPFADKRALEAAAKLGLPDDPNRLAELVLRGDFPRLVVALTRADRAGAINDIKQAA